VRALGGDLEVTAVIGNKRIKQSPAEATGRRRVLAASVTQ
jgi:hypothetical protein